MKRNQNARAIMLMMLIMMPVLTAFAQIKNQVSISGKISNNNFPKATLMLIGQETKELQTATISPSGEFSMQQDISGANFYKLEFDKSNFVMLILKPGEVVSITTDAMAFLEKLEIKGSEETMQIFTNQRIIDEAKFRLDSINQLWAQIANQPGRDSIMNVYKQAYDKVESGKAKALETFMLGHTTSLANLFLPDAFPVDANLSTYQKLDKDLYAKYPDNIYVENLHKQITAAAKTAIGSLAPDFTLPDTSGVNLALSSLRGKIVLIDFWAAWCNPCMKEMPNIKKLYADFKGKGFEILGVSLDKTRPAWTKAISNNNLTWLHVSDVKFWQSLVVPLYNVSSIPYTVLLDKEGKILAKNLRGEELYRKVESLLK